jgi:tetratricopeptide (TPR) repeat protein
MSRLVIHIGMPKTDSSSIQETLFAKGRHGQFAYADLGVPNQGGMLRSFFSADPYIWGGHRAACRSHPEVIAFNQNVDKSLQMVKARGGQQVISGEDIYHLDEAALQRLRIFFSDAFQTINVIAYVCPAASFMASAFIQLVKNHGQSRLDLNELWPRYRAKLEKFDRVFSEEHVTLRIFQPESLVDGDVVQDFCQYLGVSIDPKEIRRVNESLSREATAALFAYRRNGPRYRSYKGKAEDNNRLVALLADYGEEKLRFADSLVSPMMENNRDDLGWVEARLGEPLRDSCTAAEGAITSEQDLIDIAEDSVEALAAFVERQQAKAELTPQKIANWVEKLRVAITGRASNGATPSPCSESAFLTPEQIIRLTEEKIGPAVALRELALAFERKGQIEEACNCIQAALKLRPDAKGLHSLSQRLCSGR